MLPAPRAHGGACAALCVHGHACVYAIIMLLCVHVYGSMPALLCSPRTCAHDRLWHWQPAAPHAGPCTLPLSPQSHEYGCVRSCLPCGCCLCCLRRVTVPIEHILTLAAALKGHLLATSTQLSEPPPEPAEPRARKKHRGGAPGKAGAKAKGTKKAATGAAPRQRACSCCCCIAWDGVGFTWTRRLRHRVAGLASSCGPLQCC